MRTLRIFILPAALVLIMIGAAAAQTRGLQSSDLLRLRSVGEVKFSPDGSRLAYTVINNDGPGRPYSQLWIMTIADNKSFRLGGEKEPSSNPEWSPDGRSIAYEGRIGDKSGLIVANADGSNAKLIERRRSTTTLERLFLDATSDRSDQ